MSSLASYAAPFGNDDEGLPIKKQNANAIQQKRQRNNKTMKRRDNQTSNTISNPKLEAMMNAIKKSTVPDSGLNSGDEEDDEAKYGGETDEDEEVDDDDEDNNELSDDDPTSELSEDEYSY